MSSSGKRRRDILNKFLTKTFHMITQCSDDIAQWSTDGRSFTIRDTDAFAADVLPKYFNHNKFQSFTRQLNFYGFIKQRSDPDLQAHTKAVRFSHPYFRRGEPDLLHRITRTTAMGPTRSGDDESLNSSSTTQQQQHLLVESLQQQVRQLQDHVASLEQTVESRVKSLEQDCLRRVQHVERSYDAILLRLLPNQIGLASLLSLSQPHLSTTPNLADLNYVRTEPAGQDFSLSKLHAPLR